MYLDGFFEGKESAATERGAQALLRIIEQGTCKPEGIPALAEYVIELSKSRSLLDLPIERTLVGVAHRILLAAPNIGGCEGRSRSEFAMLSALLHLENQRYVAPVRRELACQTAEAVIHPGVWIDIVRQLAWTNAIGVVGSTELTRGGNPELVRLFKSHCLTASGLYAGRGQSGIAAALYTISESGNPHALYERARSDDQAVALSCVEMRETRGAPNWVSLTMSAQEGTDTEIYRELFGEGWRTHSECSYREPHLEERFESDSHGVIILKNDGYAQRVADQFLSRGLWSKAQRAMHALSRSKGGQGRYISSIVLPAMYVAEREGQIAIAAALGQIALASHQAALRQEPALSRSIIVRTARSVADSIYGEQERTVQSQIHCYTDPLPDCDGMGGYGAVVPMPVPTDLEAKAEAIHRERAAFEIKLIADILKTINRLFETVIEQGISLKLELF